MPTNFCTRWLLSFHSIVTTAHVNRLDSLNLCSTLLNLHMIWLCVGLLLLLCLSVMVLFGMLRLFLLAFCIGSCVGFFFLGVTR